ncbi:hypothetical protein Tsubulata_036530 [Turnera subulata]|uniref:DUF4283 domain-containing protein n=1 Tax=Turnera subulata TaxID=218843 RepID=A0A9Q0FRW1_9ROSI|nr:hypothetical protein Tsubulata_036530 [Turnera subulata]
MASIIDATGLTRAKSSMVMDLGKINLQPNLAIRGFTGKNVANTILAPVGFVSAQDAVVAPVDSFSKSELHVPSPVAASGSTAPRSTIPLQAGPTSTSNVTASSETQASWAKVVSTGTSTFHQSLDFVEPVFAADNSTIHMPAPLLDIGRKKYSLCLVGQFMGTTPKMVMISAVLNELWGRHGYISVSAYKDGLILVQFPVESTLSRALYGGPWHVGGVPLILRPWSSSIQKDGSFCCLSSYCSKLFKADCANICVDVDFSQPLKHELVVDIHGEQFTIEVAYSWIPQHCDFCKSWGHHELACAKKKPVTKWIPKIPTAAVKVPPHPSVASIATAPNQAELTPLVAAVITAHVDHNGMKLAPHIDSVVTAPNQTELIPPVAAIITAPVDHNGMKLAPHIGSVVTAATLLGLATS